MKKYKYIGKAQMAFTLGDGKEFILLPGQDYELPSENSHISSLVAQLYLEPIEKVKNLK